MKLTLMSILSSREYVHFLALLVATAKLRWLPGLSDGDGVEALGGAHIARVGASRVADPRPLIAGGEDCFEGLTLTSVSSVVVSGLKSAALHMN